jgi:hypothetical protein
MAKLWNYTDAAGQQVSDMICTACHRKIVDGEYRFRETDDAYLPQHRACSAADPQWARIDDKRRQRDRFFARRKDALQAFVNEFGAPDDDLIDECMASRDVVSTSGERGNE